MPDESPLVPPQPDPHDPAMEARIHALEAIIGEVRAELKAMRHDIADLKMMRQDIASLKQDVGELKATTLKMQIDLARLDGRVSQMPTLLQLITVVVAIWGMAFATLRFAGH